MKKPNNFEALLFKSKLTLHTYRELLLNFKEKNRNYLNLLNLPLKTENDMLENNFMRYIINDILATEDYTLDGIALYTNTPKDIVIEFASGINTNPSINFFFKVIALHLSVKPDMYKDILSKFMPDEPEPTE